MFLLLVLSMLGYTTTHKSTAVSRISGLYSVWMDHGQKVKYTETEVTETEETESGGRGWRGTEVMLQGFMLATGKYPNWVKNTLATSHLPPPHHHHIQMHSIHQILSEIKQDKHVIERQL